jgi:outer membrane lipoprotein carrier protein
MKIMRHIAAAFCLAAVIAGASMAAPTTGTDTVVEGLQKKYDSVSTIEAAFTQAAFTASLNSTETNEGRVYFKKPGKWKWLYKDPAKGVFTSDGKKIWLYEPDFNQVLEKDVDPMGSGITTDFLTGVGNLRKDFNITLAEERADAWKLELVPKRQMPNMRKLFLEVDRTKLLVVKTIVVDYLGNRTTVSFRDIKVNTKIKDSTFEFTPPKGAVTVRP